MIAYLACHNLDERSQMSSFFSFVNGMTHGNPSCAMTVISVIHSNKSKKVLIIFVALDR